MYQFEQAKISLVNQIPHATYAYSELDSEPDSEPDSDFDYR